MTNRAIAQTLFVTVETHLANVYRKLDIGSRLQLSGALADDVREHGAISHQKFRV